MRQSGSRSWLRTSAGIDELDGAFVGMSMGQWEGPRGPGTECRPTSPSSKIGLGASARLPSLMTAHALSATTGSMSQGLQFPRCAGVIWSGFPNLEAMRQFWVLVCPCPALGTASRRLTELSDPCARLCIGSGEPVLSISSACWANYRSRPWNRARSICRVPLGRLRAVGCYSETQRALARSWKPHVTGLPVPSPFRTHRKL
jgi:hypothetical protein